MGVRPASYYRPVDLERMRYVASLIPKGSRVLDVGAYNGKFAEFCEEREVISIDTNPQGSGVVQADATRLPFSTKSFDCVVAMEILEHLTVASLWAAVAEIRRVSSNTIIISVPSNEIPLGVEHLGKFTNERLRMLFSDKRCETWEMGERDKYVGIRQMLGSIDIRLLGLYNRIFGDKRGRGAIWLVARFSEK